jgi:membrane-bound serine protease (ClpP class)
VAEIFLIPGFGVAGVSGMLCLAAGIYLSLTRVPIPEYTWDFMRLRDAGITVMLASLLFILLIMVTWKVFPQTRLARGLILAHTESAEAGYTVQNDADHRAALGLQGNAATMLRPSGRGRFGNVSYDVVTRGEFIDAGRPIQIIEVEGNRYVVQEIEEKA